MIIPYVRDSQYDSLLDTSIVNATTNANLYIIIRVHMHRYDPPGGTGTIQDVGNTTVNVINWSSGAEFNTFCQTFKQGAESAWNNKLWLVPRLYAYWGCDYASYRPNVRCCLRIRLVPGGGNAHLRITCYKLNLIQGYRPHMNRAGHHGEISSYDIQPLNTGGFNRITGTQIRAAHEIGHYLGLGHVNNLRCTGTGTNSSICYGSTKHQFDDIMGGGMRVENWHVRPWRNRINQHLILFGQRQSFFKSIDWYVTMQRPTPRWIGREAEVEIPPEL